MTTHCTDCAPAHGYQGWANYETWAVALWLDNDQNSYHHARELAADARKQAEEDPVDWITPDKRAVHLLADVLKELHEDGNPLDDASVYTDLLRGALSDVDWHEVAQHYFED